MYYYSVISNNIPQFWPGIFYQSVDIDYIGICKHFVFVNLEMTKKKEYILGKAFTK